MRCLVIHDVDAIQRYIFATSKLREIRGASALIEMLNRNETQSLMNRYGGTFIYAGGGGVAADFDLKDKGNAEAFCREVTALYVSGTFSASSTGVVVEYDEAAPLSSPQSFKTALNRAHHLLRQEKASRFRKTQILTGSYMKRCEACGVYPAAYHDRPRTAGENGRFICSSCQVKCQQAGVERGIYSKIRSQASRDIRFPRELDEIGDAADPSGHIGVIYADGNRIGDRLQQIKSKDGLKAFSQIIDEATQDSICRVLLEYYQNRQELLPVLVPLCGGDDLVVITPGQDAFQIALDYMDTFQDHVRRNLTKEVAAMLDSREVSACAGVAIAKSHTPLSALVDLAHELCGLAKRRNFEIFRATDPPGQEVPCIDFQVITTPTWGNVEEVRRTEYRLADRIRLTARPYTACEAKGLLHAAKTMKREKLPPGKLHDLYRSLRQGKHQAMLHYLMLYWRAREGATGPKQQSALQEAAKHLWVSDGQAPWQPWAGRPDGFWQTPYGDLVELYGFIPE